MRGLSNQSQGNIRCKYNLLRKRNKKHRLVQWTIKYRNIHASFWLTILMCSQLFRLVFVSNIYQLHGRLSDPPLFKDNYVISLTLTLLNRWIPIRPFYFGSPKIVYPSLLFYKLSSHLHILLDHFSVRPPNILSIGKMREMLCTLFLSS